MLDAKCWSLDISCTGINEVSLIYQTIIQSVFLLRIEMSCPRSAHRVFFSLFNTTLQEAPPGWYQLSGIPHLQFVRLRVDVETTFFSVLGSNLFSTDREHLASFSASSATDTYRGISVNSSSFSADPLISSPVFFIMRKPCSGETTLVKPRTVCRPFTASQISNHPENSLIHVF